MLLIFLLPLIVFAQIRYESLHLYEPGEIQYIIIASNKGPKSGRLSYQQQLSAANKQIANDFLSKHPNPTPELGQRYYDSLHVDQTFQNMYGYTKTMELLLLENNTYKKEEILGNLSQRFKDDKYKMTIFYFSGQSNMYNAGLVIGSPEEVEGKWDHLLVYQDIVRIWKNKGTQLKIRHLLIILDTSYGERWIKKCFDDIEFQDISIIAATTIYQLPYDIGMGGYFTYNMMQAIRPFQPSVFIRQPNIEAVQNISSMGIDLLIQKLYGMNLFYDSWDSIFLNVNKTVDELL